jgi:hypothetical protein
MRFEADPKIASKNANVSFVLFAIGSLVCLAKVPALFMFTNGPEMVALASNLVHNGFYGNPSPVLNTGPSAQNPPLYPFILAFLMISLRNPYAVRIAALMGCIITNALTAAWLPRVSWLFFSDVRPGIVASIFWLLSLELMPGWDVSYTTALLLFFCLFTATTVGHDRLTLPAIFAGLLGGALFLFNPASTLVFLAWLAYLLVGDGAPARRPFSYCCIVVATTGLIAFGWMLRNELVLGGFVTRTNFGMTFYASNNDCAQPNLIDDFYNGCYSEYHPAGSLKEAQILLSMGEVRYDRARTDDTEAWIRSHPARFAQLSAARIFYFWFPSLDGTRFRVATIWIATILSFPGIALMVYRRVRFTLFVVTVLLVYPLMYYVVMSSPRYRYPILWLTLLPAGYFVQWLGTKLSGAMKKLLPFRKWQRLEAVSGVPRTPPTRHLV